MLAAVPGLLLLISVPRISSDELTCKNGGLPGTGRLASAVEGRRGKRAAIATGKFKAAWRGGAINP